MSGKRGISLKTVLSGRLIFQNNIIINANSSMLAVTEHSPFNPPISGAKLHEFPHTSTLYYAKTKEVIKNATK